ncbi:MAG: hypothetical protein UHM23_08510 [Clostridia bacterium]|nr:hypothetical protein [Clostridia bacterium]
MSMITEQVKRLREAADFRHTIGDYMTAGLHREAADTIETLSAKIQAANMERSSAYYNGGWIPVKERLPERAEGGCDNWHTERVMVSAYGNMNDDGWESYETEIMTGRFIELEDAETREKDLCFEPDTITLFMPDEWDFIILDKDFKGHDKKENCLFYIDDTMTKTEYHDRFIQITAWQPLPEPYREDGETE